MNTLKFPKHFTKRNISSSLRANIIKALIPENIPNKKEDIESVTGEIFKILSHTSNGKYCAYCSDEKSSEWDHFRPVVRDKRPTGYLTDIYNLVPSCGKCNQSKGNKYWKDWIVSEAKLSPKVKGIEKLGDIIENLSKYEEWSELKVKKLDSQTVNEIENKLKIFEQKFDELISSILI